MIGTDIQSRNKNYDEYNTLSHINKYDDEPT